MIFMANNVDATAVQRRVKLMNMARKRDNVKLSREKVLQIYQDHRPLRQIAADYGVSKGLIGKVKKGEAWADVYKQTNPWAGL